MEPKVTLHLGENRTNLAAFWQTKYFFASQNALAYHYFATCAYAAEFLLKTRAEGSEQILTKLVFKSMK